MIQEESNQEPAKVSIESLPYGALFQVDGELCVRLQRRYVKSSRSLPRGTYGYAFRWLRDQTSETARGWLPASARVHAIELERVVYRKREVRA